LHLCSEKTNTNYYGYTRQQNCTDSNGEQQRVFAYMLEMHYELIGIGIVKMMVGVKQTGEKVQYCITAIKA
jgi:hypothetical protein